MGYRFKNRSSSRRPSFKTSYPSQSNQAGFSLLEVLVAFSILAISLAILFQIYSQGNQSVAASRDYTKALIIAESQLAALDLEKRLEPSQDNGQQRDGYNWQRRISIHEGEDSGFQKNHQLLNVEITVSWQTMGRERSLSLHSKRLSGI